MTPLRTRFIEDMQLHGYSPRTQITYVDAVRGLARYFGKSPDLVTEEELRRYFLHLTQEKKMSRSTITNALCAIKLFFQKTLQRDWTTFELLRPAPEKKLPVVLTPQEVRDILKGVRNPIYRVCLTTIYSCGLRLTEGATLKIQDLDTTRMLMQVRGKGNKDRLVPLPQRTLELMRQIWPSHQSRTWLFPAVGHCVRKHHQPDNGRPVSASSLQGAFRGGLVRSAVRKPAHIHSLRHSYATSLLEAGVNLRIIQAILGHTTPTTTAIYTHLTQTVRDSVNAPIRDLVNGL